MYTLPEWFLRFAMSLVFLAHGAEKILMGIGAFAEMFGLSMYIAFTVIVVEITAGIGFLVGGITERTFFKWSITRISALLTFPVLIGAISMSGVDRGFGFMNSGWEFEFTLMMLALFFFYKD